jgi:hypothetical protein
MVDGGFAIDKVGDVCRLAPWDASWEQLAVEADDGLALKQARFSSPAGDPNDLLAVRTATSLRHEAVCF